MAVLFVSEEELQALFKRLRIWERYESGELDCKVLRKGRWKKGKGNLRGTRSEYWGFFVRGSNGDMIARTHQHVRRNRTIAGSGCPDPKEIFHEGVLYSLDLSQRRPHQQDGRYF